MSKLDPSVTPGRERIHEIVFEASRRQVSTQSCPECAREGHDADATYCKFYSAKL